MNLHTILRVLKDLFTKVSKLPLQSYDEGLTVILVGFNIS